MQHSKLAPVNEGRGLAEDIFCLVEAMLPSGSGVLFSFQHTPAHIWPSSKGGRACQTMTFDAQTILPPGAELMMFTLVLNVDGREKVTMSSRCRAARGEGQEPQKPSSSHSAQSVTLLRITLSPIQTRRIGRRASTE